MLNFQVLQVFFEKLTDREIRMAMITTDQHHGQRTILHEVVRQHSPKLDNPYRNPNTIQMIKNCTYYIC